MRLIACAAIVALFPFAAVADAALTLSDGLVRSGNPKSAAAYLTIENNGATDCHLAAVASEVAERVELHQTLEQDGVMKMVPVQGGVDIPAGATHLLEPGGDHVMMMGLHQPLTEGQVVPLSLDFGDCGMVEVELPVAKLGHGKAMHH